MSADLFTDLLVVGAGPAGLTAALAAAESGASVLLCDLNAAPGGQIWRGQTPGSMGEAGRLLRQVHAHPRVTVRSGAEVTHVVPGPGRLPVVHLSTAQGPLRVQPERLVLASGATERFLPFPGWTLPGVVGAGGLQAMVKAGLEVRGARVVVAGSGPLLLAVSAGLRAHGAQVLAVAEQAPVSALLDFALAAARSPGRAAEAARLAWTLRGVPYLPGRFPLRAEGEGRLQRVTLGGSGRPRTLTCDWLAVGFGLVPDTRLAALLGCRLTPDGAVAVNAWQATSVPGVYAAGELTGVGGVDKARTEGFVAGCVATGQAERLKLAPADAARHRAFQASLDRSFALRPKLRGLPAPDTLVCRCEDVPHSALHGLGSWTEAKLQTRCGMGACQGRVCGPAAETLYGWSFTGVRPPLSPVSLADLLAEDASAPIPGEPHDQAL